MKENSYEIYQLKNDEKNRDIQFMGTDYLQKKGIPVQRKNCGGQRSLMRS
jgi:hypothetical protein